MSGMEKISEAILDRVKVDAQNIVKEAENKAREGIEKAKKQQKAKLEEDRGKLIEEAEAEAARILAQASIKVRQELLTAKTAVIDEIVGRAKKALSGSSHDESLVLNLTKEAINTLDIDKARVYVSPRDSAAVKKLIKGDKELASKVTEVKEFDCTGGVIVEDIDGKIRIDNTYETRLEMLLPRLLPEINKELFKGL
jgi:V/A-type H+-transporting ATPase subunit E